VGAAMSARFADNECQPSLEKGCNSFYELTVYSLCGWVGVNLSNAEKLLTDSFADEKALKMRDKSRLKDEKLRFFMFIFCPFLFFLGFGCFKVSA
jgi:hypothetical protein